MHRRLLWRWGAELPPHLQNPQNHPGWERPSGSPRHPQHPVHQTLPVHGFTRSWCPRNSFLLSPQTGQLLALPLRAAALPGFLPCVGTAGPSSTRISLGTRQALGTLGTHLSLGWAGSSPPLCSGGGPRTSPGASGWHRELQDVCGCSRNGLGELQVPPGGPGCSRISLGAPGCGWVLKDVPRCSGIFLGAPWWSWVLHNVPGCPRIALGAPGCPWTAQDILRHSRTPMGAAGMSLGAAWCQWVPTWDSTG